MAYEMRWSAAACTPLACLVLAAAAAAQSGSDGCAGAQQVPTAKTMSAVRAGTLCLLNDERIARGLHPLSEAPIVTWTAQAHSEQMVTQQFFAHGRGVAQKLAGSYWAYGQNLAWAEGSVSTPEHVVAAWMASPRHRSNILHADFAHIGIGVAVGAPQPTPLSAATYTTDFGAPIRDAEPEEPAGAQDDESSATPPPDAMRPVRPNVTITRPMDRPKACATKSRAKRKGGACRKPRRPKVTVRTRRSPGSTSELIPRQ